MAGRSGIVRACWHVAAVALAHAVAMAAAGAEAAPVECAGEAGAAHLAVRALDGDTILLDDGTEVRLIGALAPKPETLRVKAEDWPPARDAKRALDELVEGRTVELRYEARRRDRYGRTLAHVFVRTANGLAWVEESLIRSGHARAYALPGQAACLGPLMRAEEGAREQRAGLWQQAIYEIESAGNAEALLRRQGRFTLVEGRVVSVTHAGRETFVNFGSDWRRDFTASLPRTTVDEKPGTRERLTALAGRRVRVRGWIERRNGPMIHLASPDEIETLDTPDPQPP
jgi:micrococcal nuclease